MPSRIRSAKKLAQRHDLSYFKKWTGPRILRTALAYGAPLVAIIWFAAATWMKGEQPVSSGPLSPVHAFTGKRCDTCHKPLGGNLLPASFSSKLGFRNHVSDESCLNCHSAPAHHDNQMFTPSCASCHLEHRGSAHLERTSDRSCTQCHAALKTKTGPPHVIAAILGFSRQHPEFAPLREQGADPGHIKFNHSLHLKRNLLGPKGRVQVDCNDCHRPPPDLEGAWRFGEAKWKLTGRSSPATNLVRNNPASEQSTSAGRAYLAVPTYANTCMACHSLEFDKHIPESAPHDWPEVVHDFVVRRLTLYAAQHPEVLREGAQPRHIPRAERSRAANSAAEWVRLRTEDAEDLLWRKTCSACHSLQIEGAARVPKILSANIPERWLPKSRFSHYSHMAVNCSSCHQQALRSTSASDVLLPGMRTCVTCHNGTSEKVEMGSTDGRCSVCHSYHNWKDQQPVKGSFTLSLSLLSPPEHPGRDGGAH